jgi:serine/threonine protein kinase
VTEDSLFNEALSKPPSQRGAFLDEACAGQPELRAAVEARLAEQETRGDAPDDRAASAADGTLESRASRAAPRRFSPGEGEIIAGRYALVEKIGEGGMGEVWVARQTQPVRRTVALKLVKPGMDSKAVLARFEQERQALGMMDHPNIASVLDGGLTEDRRPFFVMDFVEGLPLTTYCDEMKLGPRERLALFVPICQAVQHAHQKGIVHRDLKPSNILVTTVDGHPVPKVIDFGVAKATAGRLTDVSLATEFGAVVGTLEYMAPEQAGFGNQDIDTRADIYSLGVVLYELLTGLRPHDSRRLERAALTEMIRVIQEEEPSKPSTRLSGEATLPSLAALRRTEPRRLTALLRGELDWVVMKCLEKDRTRRYETANGLARDIQRYLSDEPVEARPPSAAYRLRKLAARHRAAALATALVLAAVMTGTALATWQAIVANRARVELAKKNAELVAANARERQRFDLALEAIGAFHTGVSEDVLLKQQEFEPLRKKLLGAAADFYRKLESQLGNAADPRSRAALAKAHSGLGGAAAAVGSNEQAIGEFERARSFYEGLVAAAPSDPAPRRELARVLIETANVFDQRKEPDRRLKTAARAVAVAEELAARRPALANDQVLLARALNTLGQATDASADEKERLYKRSAEIAGQLIAAHPDVAEYRNLRASALGSLANVAYSRSRYEESVERNADAAESYAVAHRLDPGNMRSRRGLGVIHGNAGLALGRVGRSKEALAEFRQAAQIFEEMTAEQPAVIEYHQLLSGAYQNIAWAASSLGRTGEAVASVRRQVAVLTSLVARHPDRPDLKSALALARLNTGIMLSQTGRSDEAFGEFRAAVALLEALVKAYPAEQDYQSTLATTFLRLGWEAGVAGNVTEATTAYQRAVDTLDAVVKAHPTDPQARGALANAWRVFGWQIGRSGRVAEGLAALGRARDLAERLVADQPTVPESRSQLRAIYADTGFVLRDAGDESGSLAAFKRAQAIASQLAAQFPNVTSYRADMGRLLSAIGLSYQRTGHSVEARAALQQCMKICEQVAAEDPKRTDQRDELGRALANLGYLEALAGDPAVALPLHQRAVAVRSKVVAEAPSNTDFQRGLASSLTYLGQTYRRLGQFGPAGQALERALALVQPLTSLPAQVSLVQELQLETRLELGLLRLAEGHAEEAAGHLAQAARAATGRPDPSLGELVMLAGIHAQLSRVPDAVVAAMPTGAPVAATSGSSQADQAMGLLTRAVEKGYGDSLLLGRSEAYDPLRERGDFRAMLAGMTAKAHAGAR